MNILSTFAIAAIAISCSSTSSQKDSVRFEDYSIDNSSASGKEAASVGFEATEAGYYENLEEVNNSIEFKTSFPMFVGIEGSKSYFGNIPPVAQDPTPSRLLLKFGSCQMFLKTGPVQVQRYILSNTWVKIEREVTANRGIKLKPNSMLNIRMESQLGLQIPQKMFAKCKQKLEGRKVSIGRVHLNRSWVDLIPKGESKSKKLIPNTPEDSYEQIYIRWDKGNPSPIVRNDIDFPATVRSPIYSANMDRRGFYYLAFQPVMRLSTSDSLVFLIER